MFASSVPFRALVCLASLLAAGLAVATEPSPGVPADPLSPEANVAVIGKNSVSYAELLEAASQSLGQQEAEYVAHQEQLKVEYERARHATLDTELQNLVNKRVLELEAKAKKASPEALLAKLGTPSVTEAEERQFYEEHKAQTQETYDKLESRIKDHLVKQKSKAATDRYYASLRTQYKADIQLEPLRAHVVATGPSRGPQDAPVTIIEFADFQCPYCRSLAPVLKEVLQRYPERVRLVYRNFPLTTIHPQALQAAQAAMCADKQGKFWDMYDALYGADADLGIPGLRATAQRVGVDSGKFEECVRGQETNGAIDEDRLAATGLAVNGTPALFINGRFLGGAVPLETISSVIDDELRRKKPSSATARLSSAR